METVEVTFKEWYPTYKDWIEDINCCINADCAEADDYIDEHELREEYENETYPDEISQRINWELEDD